MEIQSIPQYSLNGRYPQELPNSWKYEDGTLVTGLRDLTTEELESLGWYGPVLIPSAENPVIPNTSIFTHNYTWDSSTKKFIAVEKNFNEKESSIKYTFFWREFMKLSSYEKIRNEAKVSLDVNVNFTELVSLISYAQLNDIVPDDSNYNKIQECINEIYSKISFTEQEIQEFLEVWNRNGMFAAYTLPI